MDVMVKVSVVDEKPLQLHRMATEPHTLTSLGNIYSM